MKIDFKSFTKKWTRPESNQFPIGSRVYKGFQGSGKTLSMVKYAKDLLKAFPDLVIFSNIRIYGLEQLYYHQSYDENDKCFYYERDSGNYQFIHDDNILKHALMFRNGTSGVLVLLDEAHLYFNKKSGISLDVLTAISQQRKDRKRLVFSSQIWEELDISLRKQVKEIVTCKCFLKHFQFNVISDGETIAWDNKNSCYVASKLYSEVFKHNDDLYNSYNTYQKIITNQEYNRDSNSDRIISVTSQPFKKHSFSL